MTPPFRMPRTAAERRAMAQRHQATFIDNLGSAPSTPEALAQHAWATGFVTACWACGAIDYDQMATWHADLQSALHRRIYGIIGTA